MLVSVLYLGSVGLFLLSQHFGAERPLRAAYLCCLLGVAAYMGYRWTYGRKYRRNLVQRFFQEHPWLMPLGCAIGVVALALMPLVAGLGFIFLSVRERGCKPVLDDRRGNDA